MNRFPLRITSSNPFYLISAACMLGGCLAINRSLSGMNIPMPRDILFIATLNLYEAALIALGWYLVHCRRLVHDGAMLVALEAFFLVDIAFVNAEAVTSNLGIGLSVNVILFLAAILKLYFLAKIAGFSPRGGRFAAITIQLMALFALPMVFRHFDNGELPENFFYGAWWASGLLIPVCLWVSDRPSPVSAQPSMNGIVRLLSILPWMSFVLHISNLHWVYNVTYELADAAPVLLGLACLMRHLQPSRFVGLRDLRTLQAILPAVAVLLSLANPAPLGVGMGKHGRFLLTPTDLSIAGAYLTYIYCFARRYAKRLLAMGLATAMAVLFGPTTDQLCDSISRTWNWVSDAFWSFAPKTAIGAGITAIVAAFAFLGLGAIVSLRRRPPAREGDE
jgi:hypothetical protein